MEPAVRVRQTTWEPFPLIISDPEWMEKVLLGELIGGHARCSLNETRQKDGETTIVIKGGTWGCGKRTFEHELGWILAPASPNPIVAIIVVGISLLIPFETSAHG
jgi:hypothetical protein